MRKILKRLRKDIKKACLTAALVTCWSIGQTAQANVIPLPDIGDEITMQFSGSISPDINDLSHVYLIYGTGYSPTILTEFGAVKLGDFSAGQTTPFSVYSTAKYDDYFGWIAVGLHGDIRGGQYVDGLNGVTMAHPRVNEGDDFNWHTYTDIEVMFDLLINDDLDNLADNHSYYSYTDTDFVSPGTSAILWDFSTATQNGEINLAFEIVPEPTTMILLSSGWFLVVASRRQKH